MGTQTWEREKFIHETMYRSHEMRVTKQLLSRRRITKALLDLAPSNIGVGEDANSTPRFCPFAREYGQLRHEQCGFPTARAGFDVKRRR